MARAAEVVTGAPGSGKSSVAGPLARALGLPLISKDVIKESLYDSLPVPVGDEREWSRAIGGAAMELLWALAAHAPLVVLEANFRPLSEYERAKLLGLQRAIIEVHCDCPLQIAAERYNARALRSERHAGAHAVRHVTPEQLEEWGTPLGLGAVISVDTTEPVDVPALAEDVAAALQAAGEGG